MISDHPIQLDVTSPEYFDRVQLLLRLALSTGLAWFGITAGWLATLLYVFLPIAAAISISAEGRDNYLKGFGNQLWRVLSWVIALSAYMTLVTDRFPTNADNGVRIDMKFTAQPTIGSSLAKLVTSIPSALALSVLSVISCILCLVALVVVVVGAAMPGWILAYQRAMLRWQARLVAYHASLVEEYPPFALETDDDHRPAATAA